MTTRRGSAGRKGSDDREGKSEEMEVKINGLGEGN